MAQHKFGNIFTYKINNHRWPCSVLLEPSFTSLGVPALTSGSLNCAVFRGCPGAPGATVPMWSREPANTELGVPWNWPPEGNPEPVID